MHHQVSYFGADRKDAVHVFVTPTLQEAGTSALRRRSEDIASIMGGGERALSVEEKARMMADPDFRSASRQITEMSGQLNGAYVDILPYMDAHRDNILFRQTPNGPQPVVADAFRSTLDTNSAVNSVTNAVRQDLDLPKVTDDTTPDSLLQRVGGERSSSWRVRDFEGMQQAIRDEVRAVWERVGPHVIAAPDAHSTPTGSLTDTFGKRIDMAGGTLAINDADAAEAVHKTSPQPPTLG